MHKEATAQTMLSRLTVLERPGVLETRVTIYAFLSREATLGLWPQFYVAEPAFAARPNSAAADQPGRQITKMAARRMPLTRSEKRTAEATMISWTEMCPRTLRKMI